VVSHAFDMGDWKPDQRDTVGYRNVYMWIVPAKVEGQWNLKTGDGKTVSLDLKQKFQELEGTATVDGKAVPIRDAHLKGEEITFTLDTGEGRSITFTGKVDGNAIKGAPPQGGQGGMAGDWQATKAS
jgi:hypothetical protein